MAFAMRLVIVFGTIAAALLFDELTLWEAPILAVVLAPTTPASVRRSCTVPGSVRHPAVIERRSRVERWIGDAVLHTVRRPRQARRTFEAHLDRSVRTRTDRLRRRDRVLFGGIGGWLLRHANERRWVTDTRHQLILVALGLASFLVALEVGATSSAHHSSLGCS